MTKVKVSITRTALKPSPRVKAEPRSGPARKRASPMAESREFILRRSSPVRIEARRENLLGPNHGAKKP